MKNIEKESLSPIQRERLKRGPYFLRKKLRNIEKLSFEDENILFINSSYYVIDESIERKKFFSAELLNEKKKFLDDLYRKMIYDDDITDVLKFIFRHKISINIKNL